MEIETGALLRSVGGSRNGYQTQQQILLACGALTLRRPRIRGQSGPSAAYLKVLRGRKAFQESPFLFLEGLARRDLSLLGRFLEVPQEFWTEAERASWLRLSQWRDQTLCSRGDHCLVLQSLSFGPDLPQLLVAVAIDQRGQAEVLDAQSGDASEQQSWSELCHRLKERSIPSPILVRGTATDIHWPHATVL
ncbi:hypothetical protein JST97_00160 [bacterium]|nr:hypothetical protein [bacterium]